MMNGLRWLFIPLASVTVLVGCASTTGTTTVQSQSTGDDGINPNTQALVDQSQRDVELLLRSHSQSASDTSEEKKPVQWAEAPTERAIEWNDPSPSLKSKKSQIAFTENSQAAGTHSASASRDEMNASPIGAAMNDSLTREEKVDLLIRELMSTSTSDPASDTSRVRKLIVKASMSLLDSEHSLDAESFTDLTESERETLQHLQMFFSDLHSNLADHDIEVAVAHAIEKLHDVVTHEPVLSVPKAALCARVDGFGEYSPFDKYTFLAHHERQVIVYLEIENFTSEKNDAGEFVTDLAQQLTIYTDADGLTVWKEEWQKAKDVNKNKREDFFTVQVVTLPSALSVGSYFLKARVRDEKSGMETETSIPFEMIADPKMAVVSPEVP